MSRIGITTFEGGGNNVVHGWQEVNTGDTFEWLDMSEFPDKTVQISGTITAFQMEGTNDLGMAGFTLKDYTGTDISLTGPGAAMIQQNPRYIRPKNVTATNARILVSSSK